jgi:hypothetical protein
MRPPCLADHPNVNAKGSCSLPHLPIARQDRQTADLTLGKARTITARLTETPRQGSQLPRVRRMVRTEVNLPKVEPCHCPLDLFEGHARIEQRRIDFA